MTTYDYTKLRINRLQKLAYHMLTFGMYYSNIGEPIRSLSARILASIKSDYDATHHDNVRTIVSDIIENSNLPSAYKDIFLVAFENIPKVHSCFLNNQSTKEIEELYEPIDLLIKHIITTIRTSNAIIRELYESELLPVGISDIVLINAVDNQTITIILDNLNTQLADIELCAALFDAILLKSLSKQTCYLDKLFDTVNQLGYEIQCMRISILVDSENINEEFKWLYFNLSLDPYVEEDEGVKNSFFNIDVALIKHYKYIQDIFTDKTAPSNLKYVTVKVDHKYDW